MKQQVIFFIAIVSLVAIFFGFYEIKKQQDCDSKCKNNDNRGGICECMDNRLIRSGVDDAFGEIMFQKSGVKQPLILNQTYKQEFDFEEFILYNFVADIQSLTFQVNRNSPPKWDEAKASIYFLDNPGYGNELDISTTGIYTFDAAKYGQLIEKDKKLVIHSGLPFRDISSKYSFTFLSYKKAEGFGVFESDGKTFPAIIGKQYDILYGKKLTLIYNYVPLRKVRFEIKPKYPTENPFFTYISEKGIMPAEDKMMNTLPTGTFVFNADLQRKFMNDYNLVFDGRVLGGFSIKILSLDYCEGVHCEEGKCGSDGCGGVCPCPSGKECRSGLCITPKVPDCEEGKCGSNWAGGWCPCVIGKVSTESGGFSPALTTTPYYVPSKLFLMLDFDVQTVLFDLVVSTGEYPGNARAVKISVTDENGNLIESMGTYNINVSLRIAFGSPLPFQSFNIGSPLYRGQYLKFFSLVPFTVTFLNVYKM